MTMKHSSRWWFVCAVPLVACGSEPNDKTVAPSNDALTGTGRTVCGTANENEWLNLSCPAGRTISSIKFASYGTPAGSCGAYTVGACDAASSSQTVADACLGQASCAVEAN